MRQSGTHGGAPSQSTIFTEEAMTRCTEKVGVHSNYVLYDSSIEPVLDVSKTPLEWWPRNAHKDTLIAQVAYFTLVVLALSASSERVF